MIKFYRTFTYLCRNSYRTLSLHGVYSVIFSIVIFTLQSALGLVHWSTPGALLIIGLMMSLTGWGSERLWYSAMKEIMKEPLSIAGFLTRIPFWYIASGIGYTAGMLVAKKNGLIEFYDIPVTLVFSFGAKTGILLLVSLQLLLPFVLTKKLREGRP